MANIDGYDFEGPYPLDATNFNNVAGVYVVSDEQGRWIDVGETDLLGTRLGSHERKGCWQRNASGSINIWFHGEASYSVRLQKEKQIRGSHQFSCGQI